MLACAGNPDRQTLAQLRDLEPDLSEIEIDDGIDQAMTGYRKFLEEAPKSALTPEAMRRLADLELEKEYGILGGPASAEGSSAPPPSDARLPLPERVEETRAMPAPSPRTPGAPPRAANSSSAAHESRAAFEARAASHPLPDASEPAHDFAALGLPGGRADTPAGPLEAIRLYDEILENYPDYPYNDQVLYQKARAYDELGRVDEAIAVAALLVERYPDSRHLDEIQFRRGEYFFTRKKMLDAEDAYSAVVAVGPDSDYYELALYKLGWTLYKQMLLEEALHQYMTLLDHKVSRGYDFDQVADEADAQRIADTYRVMSLCFSDLGGAEAIGSFFASNGRRSYEDRVYRHVGEFYLEKLRYNDAASTYEAFVELYPIHSSSPHFSMRVVEIYELGNFPKLVLESKKAFAERYGLTSPYWKHFTTADSPEVVQYLKSNIADLANHYHALYQKTERPEDKPAHFAESSVWYRAYLDSFPEAPETPAIHYQLADLLLEHEQFDVAAIEYERIAYGYALHERSAAAGYAAIFAHREQEKQAAGEDRIATRRAAVASTLRFVDAFPGHEHASVVLGAAVDDLYSLSDFRVAIETGRRLIAAYPEASAAIRRAAWTVIAHSSFDLEDFEASELAYLQVLSLTGEDDESREDITNNLAASIYKQGERANEAGDFRMAADQFLRIATAAPTSEIRPIAEYDAAAALIRLEDWAAAARVLESFRTAHPDHELQRDATSQLAFVFRSQENFSRAAEEYERVADEAEDIELRAEALLVAGDLYTEAQLIDRALAAFRTFVSEFTHPIEPVVVTRFKMSKLFLQRGESAKQHAELREIIAIDHAAGEARTDRVRLLAARSALILAEVEFAEYAQIQLSQPFEASLQKKQRRMDRTLESFAALVDYEVGEVTAAATYYLAETYAEFSRALLASERPSDLAGSELQDYEMVLEEEAYPFEEKSIDVHQKNLELMSSGVYNAWIEKSLAQLAVVMPGRYAKFEISSGLLESAETYVYRSPHRPVDEAPLQGTELAAGSATPAAADPVSDSAMPSEAASGLVDEERSSEATAATDSSDRPKGTSASEPEPESESESESIPAAPAALAPDAFGTDGPNAAPGDEKEVADDPSK